MSRHLLRGACALALLAVAGCVGTNGLAEAEVALTAAERSATAYVQLPLCPSTNGTLCSDPDTSAKIKAADKAAYASVQAAKTGASLDVANAAIATLTTAIPAAK